MGTSADPLETPCIPQHYYIKGFKGGPKLKFHYAKRRDIFSLGQLDILFLPESIPQTEWKY